MAYKTNPDDFARYKSQESLIAFAVIVLSVIVSLFFGYQYSFKPPKIRRGHQVPLPAPPKPVTPVTSPDHAENFERVEVKIEQGDSLRDVLVDHKLTKREIKTVLGMRSKFPQLAKLKPFHKLELFLYKKSQRLARINYYFGGMKALIIELTPQGAVGKIIKQKLEPHIHFAAGVIHHSLYHAAERAGLSEKLIYQLISNFSWDIDFHKDIHPGDKFVVIYDDYYLRDKKINEGNILAALFVTRGKTFEAIRFTDRKGHTQYYSADGRNIRTAFLRAPLHYRRISSPFNLFRMHPILHHIKPHRGVDYAAPWGTPIKATGDGRIIFVGRKGGYGKTIAIKHGSRYKTLYAHLSRYAKSSHVGRYVKQGQIIGYVGQTGMATGPHVHYEFHVDGEHVNPTTTKLPHAAPVPRREHKRFYAKAKALLAELKLYKQSFEGRYTDA